MGGTPVNGPVAALLADGRLHLQHGPIDLLIAVDAAPHVRERAFRLAIDCFEPLLGRLVEELPRLRARLDDIVPEVCGPVAQRMVAATWPHRGVYITPMAAVAGSVADHVLAAIAAAGPIRRAAVNNGGDIALLTTAGQQWRVGVVGDLTHPRIDGSIEVGADSGIGGVATSGWRGRSFSLGIADAVTVLAGSAADADAAAKPIAMAITAEHPAIGRTPANALRPDSDLGSLRVVTDVGVLPRAIVAAALDAGAAVARALVIDGAIRGACLQLQAQSRVIEGDGKWLAHAA